MAEDCTLRVEGIRKTFPGTLALNGVSLEIRRGEVHALVGENGAGKSTLMNIISGVFPADEGRVFLCGREVKFKSPLDAQRAGIGFVHQELALCPHLEVGENVFMGRLPEKLGIVDQRELSRATQEILRPFNLDIEPDATVGGLSVARQQVVEIARALSLDCRLVIFDEPTSSLNESEARTLFAIIEGIKARGISVLYISHKLSEIFEICDRITVMRDGQRVDTHDAEAVSPETVVSEMIGKEMGRLYPPKCERAGGALLRVRGLSRAPRFAQVGFDLRRGEILGLGGLVGSGRTEVARAICAIDRPDEGSVELEGRPMAFRNYREAIAAGLCYLTEDRKQDGLFLKMSIALNTIPMLLGGKMKEALLPQRRIEEIAREYRESLSIKYASKEQPVGSLSGGNQQKVLLSKLLAIGPKVLILDEPTRGIDVGAKAEIHGLLRRLAEQGIGVIVISSELPEIAGLCDRVVVMHEGRVVSELESDRVNQESIIAAIAAAHDH